MEPESPSPDVPEKPEKKTVRKTPASRKTDVNKLNVNQGYDVLPPVREDAFVVPASEWNKLRRRIENCGDPPRGLDSFAWTMVGVSGTAFFAGVALPIASPDLPQSIPIICWSGCVATLFAGAVSLYCAYLLGKAHTSIRTLILEDMQTIADRAQRTSPLPP